MNAKTDYKQKYLSLVEEIERRANILQRSFVGEDTTSRAVRVTADTFKRIAEGS